MLTTEYYKVSADNGSFTIYSETLSEGCYRQNFNYSEKLGYEVPQTAHKISLEEYEKMKAVAVGFNGEW